MQVPASSGGPTPPARPSLASVQSGANAVITFTSQSGFQYQLQSTTSLGGTWGDQGAPQAGNGGVLTFTVPTTSQQQFFRVVAQ